MGIQDRIAKLLLPPGTTTVSAQEAAALGNPQSGSRAVPLPRDPNLGNIPFPPAMPLIPALINEAREDGRADPRRYEFPVAWNLQITEQRTVPFKTLREIADNADIVRKCVEVVKGAVTGQDWDISVSDDAISTVMREDGVGAVKASQIMRDRYREDIARSKAFWRSPDRINGMSFHEWIGTMLEEVLVIDALSIYPNKTVDDKNLWSLEILDGATIKPLLDARGGRPIPPQPAYQQILWGFPRGEFTASADSDGEFTADDLVYMPRTRRPFTPYGFSPVERCLILVDLYLKRLHWYRTEFTDGVMPDLFMKSDMDFGGNPELLRGYEQVFNDALAGNLEARRRMRVLPNGFDPVMPRVAEAKYSNLFDEYLVKSITGHFGVLPSQIGFTPQSGLGGAGHQEGEANSAETLGMRPLILWVIEVLNQLNQRFLGAPPELTFVFTDGTEDDERMAAERRQVELFSGQKTWNEVRTEMGMPLFGFAEADAPLVVQGMHVVPLAATFEQVVLNADQQDGSRSEVQLPTNPGDGEEIQITGVAPPPEPPAPVAERTPEVKTELSTFIKWAKPGRTRDFGFMFVDSAEAELLNTLVKTDVQAAKDLAGVWKAGGARPKVPAREPFPANHPSRDMSDRLVSLYERKIASVGTDMVPLVDAWLTDPTDDALTWLEDRNVEILDQAELEAVLADLYVEAGWMGRAAALAMIRRKRLVRPDDVDWDDWEPGQPDQARFLLEPVFDVEELLLVALAERVVQMNNTRLGLVAVLFDRARDEQWDAPKLEREVRDVQEDPERAAMIAATEINLANTETTVATLKEAKVEMVDWLTSGGPNVCEDCAAMEADNPWRLDALPMQPPAHPNCGCQLVPTQTVKQQDPVLVKVRRNMIDAALARLAGIKDVEPGMIAVPWPVKSRPKIPTEQWADSRLEAFRIEDLYATQLLLERKTVEWHLDSLGRVGEGQNPNPNVVADDCVFKIYDGHHRLAALWLLGAEMANCWCLESR